MTIDQPLEDTTGPATLQMPQQAPPILRDAAAMSAGALGVAAGIEADFEFDWFTSLGQDLDSMLQGSLGQLIGAIPSPSQWF
ncbi:hypothetical protein [Streptomyces sp. NPDC001880]